MLFVIYAKPTLYKDYFIDYLILTSKKEGHIALQCQLVVHVCQSVSLTVCNE